MSALSNIKIKFKNLHYSLRNFTRFNCSNATIKSVLGGEHVGNDDILLKGWVKSLRKQKSYTFMHLSDGSPDQVQIVIPSSLCDKNCSFNSAVEICGKVVESSRPNQPVEVHANKLTVVGEQDLENYPFGPRKYYPPEYVRQYIHLRPKTNVYASTLRLSSLISSTLYSTLIQQDFINVFTPILTSNDCEGAGEVFLASPASSKLCEEMGSNKKPEEAYFNKKVYLTVSGQLHLEAITGGISKVFTIGPTFRSENSRTRKHLAEFRMLEAEIAFCDDLQPLLSIMEMLVKQCAKAVLEHGMKDANVISKYYNVNLEESLSDLTNTPFATLGYTEAMDLLLKHKDSFKIPPKNGCDIGSEHELFLVSYTGKPTFLVDWPANIKPFYMRKKDDKPNQVSCVDLLVPQVGELCGGSLREHRYDVLKSKLETLELDESLNWYLELRKYGGSPTGGFGMGVERLISYLLKIPNVKDIVPFPRTPHNCPM